MDQKRRLYWGRYLRDLADKMELRDWTISVSRRPCPPERKAEVDCVYGQKEAVIQLDVRFDELSLDEARRVCVHELLHIHLIGIDNAIKDLQQNYEKKWLATLHWAIRRAEEHGVDAIADIVAPFMPLPPEPKPKKHKKRGS